MNGTGKLSLVVSTLALSCGTLIGIEDAEVDPTLELGGQAGAGAQGGSSAGAGAQGGTAGSSTGGGGATGGEGGTTPSGGASTGGSAGAAGTGPDASPPETLCERFCRIVQANCQTPDQVYTSRDVCLAACEAFEEGSPGDETGNTLHCRLTNAELALSTGEPAAHCPAASPGGAGICGSNCEGYCTMMQAFCPTFGTPASCIEECATVPDIGGYNTSMQGGNTMQCRIYHVSAATQSASFHCPHAAGQAICVAPAGDQ